jgi:hypothetical protein
MDTSTRPFRTILTSLALLLAMGVGVVPSLLDQDAHTRTTLELQHDPAECPDAHDHSVCSQIQSNTAVPRAHSPRAASLPVRHEGDGLRTTIVPSHLDRLRPPPRGPPTA